MIFRWIKLLAPILIILSFLFPWYSGFFASVSALKLAINPSSIATIYEKLDVAQLSISTEVTQSFSLLCKIALILPILSLLSIILAILDRRTTFIHSLTGIVAIGLFATHFALMKFSLDFFTFASFGLYCSALFGFLLFIAAIKDKDEHLVEPKENEQDDFW